LPLLMGKHRLGVRLHPPEQGQHTTELLTQLGYPRDAIDAMRARGVAH